MHQESKKTPDMMKIGDKVRIIDYDLIGVITGICHNSLYIVTDEDGMNWESPIDNLELMDDMAKLIDLYQQTADVIPETPSGRPRSKKQTNRLEVDLHAEKLIGNTHGMDAASIIAYQMQTVRKTLAENRQRKGLTIIFIHGKGEGVLRDKILAELKKHPQLKPADANFGNYGYQGATAVTIH